MRRFTVLSLLPREDDLEEEEKEESQLNVSYTVLFPPGSAVPFHVFL